MNKYFPKPDLTKKQAIEKLGCEKKKCKYFEPNGPYTFCLAIFTENECDALKGNKNANK